MMHVTNKQQEQISNQDVFTCRDLCCQPVDHAVPTTVLLNTYINDNTFYDCGQKHDLNFHSEETQPPTQFPKQGLSTYLEQLD